MRAVEVPLKSFRYVCVFERLYSFLHCYHSLLSLPPSLPPSLSMSSLSLVPSPSLTLSLLLSPSSFPPSLPPFLPLPAERNQSNEQLSPSQRHQFLHLLCGEGRTLAGHETYDRRYVRKKQGHSIARQQVQGSTTL